MAKTDEQLAQEQLADRGVDYKYGGDSVFGAFMPERRRILRPEQEQFVGYDSSGNAIIQNIPAEYGPSEFDPSFSPVVRGARSAGSFLRDIFLGDANEQSAAFGRAASALRGMGEGIADYAGGQARSALAGGVSFNPDTGQVDRFDPLVVMGGGGAPSGSLASGLGRSRSALDTSTAARMQRAFEDFDLRPAYHYTNALEDGGEFTQLKPSIDGKYGPGIYSSRNPEYGERYLKGQENARAIPIYIRGETARKEDWFDALNEAANDAKDMRQMGIEMTSPEIRRMAQNLLRDKGYDSLEFDNEIVVFDPKNVRSVNAQFDPELRESANILYSGGGNTGTGVAAGSALRQMNPNLDQSYEARMQRARDQGYKSGLYHGAVTDISEFDISRGTPETHMGMGVYTTTGVQDANVNYAGEGPDLTNRLERRAEEIIDSGKLSEEWAEIYRKREVGTRRDVGKARNEARSDLENIAKDMARQEMKDNLGVVYPLMGRSEKPFDISEGNDTFLSYQYPEFDSKDYLDEAGGDMELAEDLARDDSYNFEPEGELTDFLSSIRRNLSDEEYEKVSTPIMESAYDGGISGKELEDIYRKAEIYAEDDLGRFNQMEIFRQGLEDAGFDSIIHDADRFNMPNVEGQKHQIFFRENQLRSPNAEFDPQNIDSADLLSSRSRPMSALRGMA